MSDDDDTQPIPYLAGTPVNWEKDVKMLQVDENGILRGACPRCCHQAEMDLNDRIGAALAPTVISIAWRCTCGLPHPGAPADANGCGAEGRIDLRIGNS